MPLTRDDMNEHGARLFRIPDVPEHRQQVFDVVPINGTHIVESEFLKQRSTGHQTTGVFLGEACRTFNRFRKMLRHFFREMPEAAIRLG